MNAHVGEPDVKYVEDSKDKKTRWIELGVPVTEGNRYKVGDFTFDGNTVVKTDVPEAALQAEAGRVLQRESDPQGLEKAREVYGTGGYFEFTGYPDLRPRDQRRRSSPRRPKRCGRRSRRSRRRRARRSSTSR